MMYLFRIYIISMKYSLEILEDVPDGEAVAT
jgi:hypothetical protein